MTTQTVRGTDLVVKLDGEDQMPALDMMEEKQTAGQVKKKMKKKYGGTNQIVYLDPIQVVLPPFKPTVDCGSGEGQVPAMAKVVQLLMLFIFIKATCLLGTIEC
jgi:hypothetical protein